VKLTSFNRRQFDVNAGADMRLSLWCG